MIYNECTEQESLFWQAFHYAPIGMALVSLDGRVLKVNSRVCLCLGYSEDELKGMYIDEHTHQDDLNINIQVKQEVLEGSRDSYSIEKRFFHKDGHAVPVQLTIILVRDKNGSPLFFISQFQDISNQKIAEKNLLEIKREYQLITENSVDIIAKYDANLNLVYISDACITILGYEPNEIVGKWIPNYCHPDDIGEIIKNHHNMLNLSEIRRLCYRIKHKAGYYIWLETTANAVFDEDNHLIEVLTFSRDVTDRKNNELQIKESEERYKSLFENHPDMTFSLNLDGYYTSINQSFQDIMGYSKEELLTKPYNFRSHIFSNYKKVEFHFNQAIKGNVQRFEVSVINKKGVNLDLDVTHIPILVDNEIVGVYVIARDITSKKKAERELKLTRERLESFIDHNVDPIVLFNNDDTVIRVNKSFEQVFGWKSSEIVGLNLVDLPYRIDEDRREVEEKVKVIKNGKPWSSYETRRKKKDGTIINVVLSGFPIQNENTLSGWSVILRDITERKQAEKLFVRSEKLSIAGQLAAGIAHEIRNPMTAIKGFIQLIKSNSSEKPEYFDIITSEMQRIELILSELLILAKPQTIHITKIEIHSTIEEVITLLNTEAILNNVEIMHAFSSNQEIFIECEVNQIKQVCINLIKNAIDAMPKGGKLIIQVEQLNQDGVIIRFIDQGYGIPESVLEKLGQPFYTTKEKGTGLGFMVSKKIIENHKGFIQVRSKVNIGTTFEVFLPLSQNN